jgi:transcriptional regulator of acetoin/glycerol metabolism
MTDWNIFLEERKKRMAEMAARRANRRPTVEADQQSVELARLNEALQATSGDVKSAAEWLKERGYKTSRATLFRRVKSLKINLASFRPAEIPVVEN